MRERPDSKENLNPPGLSLAQRSNLWPLTAWGYAPWRAHSLALLSGAAFPLDREKRLFLGLCQPQPGQRWLDVGTSTGFYAGVLAGADCRVLAADLSPAMLAQAARRERSGQIEWALLNLERSGLPDQTFDGVVIGATLNETHDPARLLREVSRLLRPAGQVWLMYVPRTGGPVQRALAQAGGLTFPDPAWVARQLRLTRTFALRLGLVQFERYVGAAANG